MLIFFLSVSRRHFKFDVRCFDRCLCKPFQFLKTPDVKCKEFYFYCLEASSPPRLPYPPGLPTLPVCLTLAKAQGVKFHSQVTVSKAYTNLHGRISVLVQRPLPASPVSPMTTHTHTHTWVHLIGETGSLCSSPGLEQDRDVDDETCTRRQFEMKYIVIFSDTIETSDKSLKQVFFIVRRRVVATATL